ncbi:hypothetical protein Lalb_Chr00c01g0403761 [Lupinus albus]|uniref:Uncharacterized protein n=1 Tax=Lupinus albus TaxID=3870 RepID=A0A6A4N1C9_LUPAL|nr:hypothetical protein Lalb_Chr00c01g0403761 [Lupinus albus]
MMMALAPSVNLMKSNKTLRRHFEEQRETMEPVAVVTSLYMLFCHHNAVPLQQISVHTDKSSEIGSGPFRYVSAVSPVLFRF